MSATVAIIDYGSGNLRSAEKAMERAMRDAGIGGSVVVTADAEIVRRAERIVLPGVGAFADCMAGLKAVPGMLATLQEAVVQRGRPFLGICVGMQLLADSGFEHGVHAGLGWISGDVVQLAPNDPSLKVPHMGWNELSSLRQHPVTAHLSEMVQPHAYFVHSYHFRARQGADVVAVTDHGQSLSAIIARDTIVGTQFHPEKSQAVGLALLSNFARWRP